MKTWSNMFCNKYKTNSWVVLISKTRYRIWKMLYTHKTLPPNQLLMEFCSLSGTQTHVIWMRQSFIITYWMVTIVQEGKRTNTYYLVPYLQLQVSVAYNRCRLLLKSCGISDIEITLLILQFQKFPVQTCTEDDRTIYSLDTDKEKLIVQKHWLNILNFSKQIIKMQHC